MSVDMLYACYSYRMANTPKTRANLAKALDSVKGGIKAGGSSFANAFPGNTTVYKKATPVERPIVKPGSLRSKANTLRDKTNATQSKNMSAANNNKTFGSPMK